MSNGTPTPPMLDPRTTTEVDPQVVLDYINPTIARAAFFTHQTGAAGGATGPPPEPAPVISSLSPNIGPVGAGLDVTIDGANFVTGITGTFNGQPIALGVASSTVLNAWIGSNLMQSPISAPVQVTNADGQASNSVTFTAV